MSPGHFYYYGGWDDKKDIVGHDVVRTQLCLRPLTIQGGNHHQTSGGNQIC